MRILFMLFKSLFGILLALCLGFSVWLFSSVAVPLVKTQFRLDRPMGSSGVERCEEILFYDRSSLYKRRFWGLGEIYTDAEWFLPYNGDMVWYGETGGEVYVWSMENGIQCVDMSDDSVREILSQEDVEATGTINEHSRFSEALYCRDWNEGRGFTYWYKDTVCRYEYETKEICEIGKSKGGYCLTEQGFYFLEASETAEPGDESLDVEQDLMLRKTGGETIKIASNVAGLTVGLQGGQLLYYSRDDQRYHLYHTGSGENTVLPPDITLHSPVISRDGTSVLYQEIDYRSQTTDDEYRYYKVMDLDTYEVTTIYSGYREWLGYIW